MGTLSSWTLESFDDLWERAAEPLLDRFEAGWRQGRPEALADLLRTARDEVRPRLGVELAFLDLEYRLRAGQHARAADYRAYVSEDAVAELAAAECQLRRRFGGDNTPPAAPDAPTGEATHVGPVVPTAPASPHLFPGYEILAELGRGGMGVVYKARQLSLNRLVALKVVGTACESPEARQRFLEEANLVARLQHPGVVQVYDYGTHEGRPYYVMEYGLGGTLAQSAAHTPQPPQTAARLVRQLAQALHYSHSQGIIHRDLKPDNVLLGADGEPKLADFGLAKQMDSRRTVTGAVLGTPSYMAPEQAAGAVHALDVRTDVYALGAVLYELLTGRPPFKAATPLETLQHVRDQDPVAPRQLQPGVPRDLETICLHCLHKEPGRRYATAALLAADLDRFLEWRPVAARPVGWVGRGWRWCRRRPREAVTAALFAAVLLLGVAGGLWVFSQQSAQAARRNALRGQAALALDDADAAVAALCDQTERLPGQQRTLLAPAQAAVRKAEGLLEALPGDDPLAARLAAARARLDAEAKNDWAVAELQRIRLQGAAYDRKHDDFVTVETTDRAYAAVFRKLGIDPEEEDLSAAVRLIHESSIRKELIAALDDWWSDLWDQRERLGDAGWERVLRLVGEADTDEWRARLRGAVRQPRRQELIELARAADVEALSCAALNLLTTALQDVECQDEAVALQRRAYLAHPADFWINHDLAVLLGDDKIGKPAEAVPHYMICLAVWPDNPAILFELADTYREIGELQKGVDLLNSAMRRGRARPELALQLGAVFRNAGKPAEAEAAYRDALRLDPAFVQAHTDLGNLLWRQKRYAEAEKAYREAIRLDPTFVRAHHGLGNALHDLKRHAEAEAAYREAIRLDPRYDPAHHGLGNALWRQKRYGEAEAAYREALRLDPASASTHTGLGNALDDRKRYAEAEAAYRKAIQLDRKSVNAHIGLGNALRHQKRYAEAEEAHRKAIQLDQQSANAHHGLGNGLYDLKRYAEAEKAYRQAIRLDPTFVYAHVGLGNTLWRLRRYTEAEEDYRAALRIDGKLVAAHHGLGNTLNDLKRYAEAEAAYREAIVLDPAYAYAHNGLGNALLNQKRYADAEAAYREAIRLDATVVYPHNGLGNALLNQKRYADAEAAYRAALRLDENYGYAHRGLGLIFSQRKQYADAEDRFRAAIRTNTKDATHPNDLGNCLLAQDRFDLAEAAYNDSIRLDPKYPYPRWNLARLRLRQDRYAEAFDVLREARAAGAELTSLFLPPDRRLELVHRLTDCGPKLDDVRAGKPVYLSAPEQLSLAYLCYYKGQYVTAARLHAAAMPDIGAADDDLTAWRLFAAAICAALAGDGEGEEADRLDADARACHRAMARGWLKELRALHARRLECGSQQDREAIRQQLLYLKTDPDLNGISLPERLAKLSAAEREECAAIWNEGERLLAKCSPK
jgi:serine/threonine-protein kinase